MACFSVAVIQARLEPKVAQEILGSEKAVEALRLLIEQRVAARPVTAQRYGGQVVFQAARTQITLGASGFQIRDSYPTNEERELLKAMQAQAERIAIALGSDRLAQAVKSRYVTTSDQTLASGARVLKLSL